MCRNFLRAGARRSKQRLTGDKLHFPSSRLPAQRIGRSACHLIKSPVAAHPAGIQPQPSSLWPRASCDPSASDTGPPPPIMCSGPRAFAHCLNRSPPKSNPPNKPEQVRERENWPHVTGEGPGAELTWFSGYVAKSGLQIQVQCSAPSPFPFSCVCSRPSHGPCLLQNPREIALLTEDLTESQALGVRK